jgi:peptidoglycan/xylan/chitin deacetylase (PgdA/CDA1 family)
MGGHSFRKRAGLLAALATLVTLAVPAPIHAGAAATPAPAVWLGSTDGGVFTLGSASFHGSQAGAPPRSPVIATAARATGNGYWLATLAGQVFAFGDAPRYGDLRNVHLNKPIVDMVATPSGGGYWLVGSDGGVFAFGNAPYRGGLGGKPLNGRITGLTPTSTGRGYWLVAADGGVFSFGDAHYRGSLGSAHIPAPIAAMASTKDGNGYWLLGRDGRVTAFGDASNKGSGTGSPNVAVGIVRSQSGAGYMIAYADGSVRSFGDAGFAHGAVRSNGPVVGITTRWAASSGFALTLLDYLNVLAHPPAPHRVWANAHEAALTFDDGPSDYTAGVLGVLRQLGVPATFFTVGYEAAARPDLLRAEAAQNSSIETHTWDHADLTRLPPAGIDSELQRGMSAIQAATGQRPTCFRPPYGATNSTVVAEASKLGLTQILWNVDPSDYLRPGVGAIVSNVLGAANGRGLVIGMHDGGGDRSQTIAALPAIISGLRARGYSFIRLCA